jgi:hypothetical protein
MRQKCVGGASSTLRATPAALGSVVKKIAVPE